LYYTASGIVTPVGGRPVPASLNLCTGRETARWNDKFSAQLAKLNNNNNNNNNKNTKLKLLKTKRSNMI